MAKPTEDDRPSESGASEEMVTCPKCNTTIGTAPKGDQVAAQRVKNNHTCAGKA